MNCWVYILKCSDNSLYVGISGNLDKRIREHMVGFVPYTKNRMPFELVHKERYNSRKEAAKREKEIKGWRREKKSALFKNTTLQ